jgi:PAS domain S-box-containing protein
MVMERYQKRLKGEEFLSRYAFRLSPKDGSTRWVEISVSAIDWEGLPATLNFLTDITERKRAEDALVESETKYHSIFDNAVMGIYQVSREGRFLSANNHAARTFGYESAEELILSITDINTQIYQDPKTGEVAKGILLEKGVLENFEVPCRHKDGQTIWVSFNARLVRDAYGNILYHEGTSQDITERKRAEEALRQVNKQLNLLSSITRHDIKNQVLALKGYIEISRDTLQDPKTLLRFLEGEELAANTIEYQITFTKNYQELGAAAPAWQNVNECIRKAMAALPMRAVHIEPDPADPDVYADPLIEKVFYNLIDNALKYGGDRMKMIRVSSQESDRGLTIVCEDDGVGISAEDKKRLFTRGFGKNTGLGLFLSREILSITSITIIENGTPGKGARFEITVPKGAYRIGMGPG